MPAATGNFESLVKAINKPRRERDQRQVIKLGPRLHDSVNALVAALRKRNELIQYDNGLAVQPAGAKHPTRISLEWLQRHLDERFKDLPPTLARFVFQRWDQFPEVIKLAACDDPNRYRKRKRGRPPGPHGRAPGPRSL